MEIKIINFKSVKIALVISDKIIIRDTQDALDLMADADYLGSRKIILQEDHFMAEFFNLKTGIAGEILQKFSTYNVELAITGDFSKYISKSLKDFIFESNKYGKIIFVNTIEEAKEKLAL
jgi:hypothetical protein